MDNLFWDIVDSCVQVVDGKGYPSSPYRLMPESLTGQSRNPVPVISGIEYRVIPDYALEYAGAHDAPKSLASSDRPARPVLPVQ
jgi:hypothetical protein